jgi:hypothetical protein
MTTDRADYERVQCSVVKVTLNAVFIKTGEHQFHWIPLSLIHTLDERALRLGPMALRIMSWKVEQLGLKK